MNLNFGKNWESVSTITTGTGTVSISNGVLNASSNVGSNSKITKHLFFNPGDQVTISCMARRISGSDPIGGIAINIDGITQNRVYVFLDDWHEISTTISIPDYLTGNPSLTVDIGVFTSEEGNVEYADPKIDISSTSAGCLRTIGLGLIQLANGVATINSGYQHFGITDLSYGSSQLSFKVPKSTGAAFTSPFFTVQSNGGGSGGQKYIAKQVSYNGADGTTTVKFVDVTTGAFADVASVPAMFIFIKAETT